MTSLCLTGWQQKSDALAALVPEAVHFNYADYDDVDSMFAALPHAPELAIGWSLGGQLLLHAVARQCIKPRKVLLLAAPFQCVAGADFPYGMPQATLTAFKRNYARYPRETLVQFQALIALGDSHAQRIARALNDDAPLWNNGAYWLDVLGAASCRSLDFSLFPETVLVHGAEDKIIHPANAEMLSQCLPHAQRILWPGCGHAPHLHDADALKELINV